MNSVVAWSRAGLLAAIALSFYSPAQASQAQEKQGPIGQVSINGEGIDFSNLLTLDPQSGLYIVPLTPQSLGGQTFKLGMMGDPDPVLTYSFSASNTSAVAIPFAFDLAIPIDPQNVGSLLASSLGITLTSPNRTTTVTETPFPLPPYSAAFQTFTGDGIDLGSSVDIGTAETFAPGAFPAPLTQTFNFFGSGVSPMAFSTLGVHISFLLSPGGNIGVTGDVEVEPADVPEPGTVAMLAGLGISGAGFLARRKNVRKAA